MESDGSTSRVMVLPMNREIKLISPKYTTTELTSYHFFLGFIFSTLFAIDLTGAGAPEPLAIIRALTRIFFASRSSADFFCTPAKGFIGIKVRIFFKGFLLTTAFTTYFTGALNTFLIASLFSKTDKLVFAILCWGSFQPCLAELGLRQVPCFLNADSVQMQNLPNMATRGQLHQVKAVHLKNVRNSDTKRQGV